MKKIVQVFGSLDAGGAESRMMDVYRSIDRKNYDFIFLTLDTKKDQFYEKEIQRLGAQIIKTSSPREVGVMRHFREMVIILKKLKSDGVDVVHSHTSYHSGIVLLAAWIAGFSIRISHARTTSSINRDSIAQRLMITLGKFLIATFATSRLALNKETAIALYGSKVYNSGSIRIINNAIDLTKFKNPPVCKDLDFIPDNATVIGHIGRFQPMKNHKLLIDIFQEYLKINPNSYLILVGDGPLRDDIEALTTEKGLEKRVVFLGLRTDVPSILKRCNVFVFPSKFEGLGGCVLEAQAAGIPCVLSSNVPSSVDMGTSLVSYCSIDKSPQYWARLIETVNTGEKLPYDVIFQVFSNKRFTLESEISDLTQIYENSHDNNDNL